MNPSASIDFKEDLNEEQYAAVSAAPGPALVLAGAGSGKTRTLTYRVAWLLLREQIHPDQLLLLTFTNKAAREMVERVKALTGLPARPRWSGTFHSIGGRILRSFGEHLDLDPGYTILDQGDSESLLNNVIKNQDKAFLKNKEHPKPRVIQNLFSFARNTRRPFTEVFQERFPWHERITAQVEEFTRLYQSAKREQQVVDFDDLLDLWLRLLKEQEEVRLALQSRFPCILVDEYQDTNILQAEIIDRIGHHHNIMAVGDDAQCIYTWRGANFDNIRSFSERHPGTRVFKILTNYRSTPPILSMANNVLALQPVDAGYPKELVAHRQGNLRPYVVPVMDTRQQAQFLAARIEALYDEGVALEEIAVLYRAHYQALDAQLELTRRGIPFVITSGLRFFEQAHVKDFLCQVRLLANPADASAAERLFGLLPKIGPATVNKIRSAAVAAARAQHQNAEDDLFQQGTAALPFLQALRQDSVRKKVPADARDSWDSLAQTLADAIPLVEEKAAPKRIIENLLDGWYPDYLKTAYADWDNRQEDLASLVGYAARFDTLPEMLAQLTLVTNETSEKSIDPDDHAVRLTTIHQAKGLEFPVVFLISCADEWLPIKRAIEEGDIEEERRLFYVAVTRAMNELIISFPMMHTGRGTVQRLLPSRFLAEIPRDQYEKISYGHSW